MQSCGIGNRAISFYQNKEISVQIKAKVENDSQMYSLKLHTLWSPMKKDGDIGIIGYFDAVN